MNKPANIQSAVRRDFAHSYILTFLVSFAATVIFIRIFLEVTGYPQIGNSVLHIAHGLWGGLVLTIAVILQLAYVNRRVIQLSALFGGIGIGLFIDEVGKFITQANDYFFPPAMPLIYGFILLNVLLYLYFRRPRKENPRVAMYRALEGLQDLLDNDLYETEAERIKTNLVIGMRSNRQEIKSLAKLLNDFFTREAKLSPAARPGLWKRFTRWIDAMGMGLGRSRHRALITIALVGWVILVAGYISTILQSGDNLDPLVLQWRISLIVIQVVVGILTIVAVILWLIQNEDLALKYGISGFLVSLFALQLLNFYISQFMAITVTLLQFAILMVLLAYQRWYLKNGD